MARPVIIDTDGGVDDACALWWALTDPTLEVVAVTVCWGNVDVNVAVGSVLRVLAAARRTEVPVAVGAAGPVGPAPELRRAEFIHGRDGLGDTFGPAPEGLSAVAEPAEDLLLRVGRERPGEVSVVAVGPLSTLAGTLRRDPGWAATVDELVVMGGSIRQGGNALPLGEANIAHDPVGAAEVVAAAWSRPPLLVGLDVTLQATLGAGELDLLARHESPAAAFLDGPVRFYRRFASTFSAPDVPCHDLLALLALAHPAVITDAPVVPLAVDTAGGPAWGATVADLRTLAFARIEGAEQSRPPGFSDWRVALNADVDLFRQMVRSLFGAAPGAPFTGTQRSPG